MASFDLSSGSASEYSDSFELDGASSDAADVLSELKKVLAESERPAVEQDPEGTALPPAPLAHSRRGKAKNDKKPPAPKRKAPTSSSSNAGKDLRKTMRSPIALARHLNRDGAQQDSDHSPSQPRASTPLPNSSAETKPPRFMKAIAKVQKLQSTTKKFQSSDEVREVVFKEWLAKKEVKNLQKRCSLSQLKKEEAENKREQELNISLRSAEAVKKWTASKEAQLQLKQQRLSREAKKQAEGAEERLSRYQVGREAAKKWREEKTKIMIQKRVEQAKKKGEEERKKEEEKEEKMMENKQAFQSWNRQKATILKEKAKKAKEVAQQLELTQQQEVVDKRTEAKKAFHAWKSQKDETIRSTKTLYTYMNPAMVHEKPWRPARGLQYSYPKSKETHERKPKAKQKEVIAEVSQGNMESYSMSSFESEAEDTENSYSDEHSSGSSVMDSVSRTTSPRKGHRKTIQVCCQTLQYWCTCESD